MSYISIKLRKLSESFVHLGKIAQIGAGQGITGRQAYWLARISETAEAEMKRLEKCRVDLVKKYGKEDAEGNASVLPDRVVDFTAEVEELLDTIVQLPGSPITIKYEAIEGMKLSALDLMRLDWLLIVDVAEDPHVSDKAASASGD